MGFFLHLLVNTDCVSWNFMFENFIILVSIESSYWKMLVPLMTGQFETFKDYQFFSCTQIGLIKKSTGARGLQTVYCGSNSPTICFDKWSHVGTQPYPFTHALSMAVFTP